MTTYKQSLHINTLKRAIQREKARIAAEKKIVALCEQLKALSNNKPLRDYDKSELERW